MKSTVHLAAGESFSLLRIASPTFSFAITGFDQAYFFLRGLHQYGKTFTGAAGMLGYSPVQTPLQFERYGNGGMRNKALLFIHYRPDHIVETIKF